MVLAWAGTSDMSSGNSSLLDEIVLRGNELYGSLPDDLCFSHPNLPQLNLQSNKLSGQIPFSLSHCSALYLINLCANNFTERPLASANLSALKFLAVYKNGLSGSLPQDLCYRYPNQKLLNVGNNQFHGSIHTSISRCSALNTIELGYNKFTGSAPDNIGRNMTKLRHLVLGRNDFTGNIPRSIGNMSSLLILTLTRNPFSARNPAELAQIPQLEVI
ncbi:OLC1v1023777C1 [Oldenlandia corymbosa var. corymbosa]|uniref:OLC1v1023777C1 n=1 Tax=Oldenlandia corymbosa var. corymbosa TaxID=529605 RepID=A0AAV1C1N1_OLDCO|nr:OLC1v1023777C1 [Oldenlandia corymbosa var. corymbosa]